MFNRLSLRLRLAALVAGSTLPLILFAAGIIYYDHIQNRTAEFQRVEGTIRGIRLVLDAKTDGIVLALKVLAASNVLQRDDIEGFRRNVTEFLRSYPATAVLGLADANGKQIFHSRIPAGIEVPRAGDDRAIRSVLETGETSFSDVFLGNVSQRRLVLVSVPVMRDGKVIYVLSFSPPLELFLDLIREQVPDSNWAIAVFDRTGTNFARVPNPEQTTGLKASPTLLPLLLDGSQGVFNTNTIEGVPLITGISRSPLSGWTVAGGVALSSLIAPLWGVVAISASIALTLLIICFSFALRMASKVSRAETLHRLLINEVNHRVKNTLAIVQSIASQTLRRATDPAEALRAFDERLAGLVHAHDVLSAEKWESASLRDLVTGVIGPYADGESRFRVGGPDIRLSPRAAVMASMALNELATNAAKYGALSTPGGQVTIDWHTDDVPDEKRARIVWTESGGPPVDPGKSGFGSRLIRDGFASQVGGRADLDMRPEGVVCTLICPRE